MKIEQQREGGVKCGVRTDAGVKKKGPSVLLLYKCETLLNRQNTADK